MLTDILHAFSFNETHPAYDPDWQWPQAAREGPAAGALIAGIHMIGHDGDGFCFDNEQPAHQVVLRPVRLAPSLVTNGEWLEFMADGGYATPTLVAVGRLGHGRGARLGGARLLAQDRRRLVCDDAWRPAPRRCRRRRYATSAITKPTRSRAGPARICRPKANGKSPPRAACSMTPSASSGNGRAAPTRHIPATRPRPARSANTTASSWSIRWCCAARRWRRRPGIRARAIATSFIRRRAGNSAGLRLAEYEH